MVTEAEAHELSDMTTACRMVASQRSKCQSLSSWQQVSHSFVNATRGTTRRPIELWVLRAGLSEG